MCGLILWVGEQNDSTTLESINSMHWRPSFQKEEELKSVGPLSKVCSQIVLKCSYLSCIGRPDILWSVKELARSITKWTKACDKRSSRLISYIHHTREYKQYCHVGNTSKQCRLELFQDSDFAGDLEDSKSTSRGTLCILGSHTFVPISWTCKKQTSVSHSSTESEIISLDAGSRLSGIPALDLLDLIVEVLHGNTVSRVIKHGETCVRTNFRFVQYLTHFKNEGKLMEWSMIWTMFSRVSNRTGQPDNDVHKHHKSQKRINVMENIDSVPQTSILLARKLCCMCLKTTKQWSRWS